MRSQMDTRGIAPEQFVVRERLGELDGALFEQVLLQQAPAVVFRRVFDPHTCELAARAFLESGLTRSRNDAVPAATLGAFHYGKSLDEYLSLVQESEVEVTRLAALCGLDGLRPRLSEEFAKRGLSLRFARHGDRLAGAFTVRSWTASGRFSLEPHEDIAQLSDPRQAGFEIQRCHNVVAVNVCLQNDRNTGQLCLWNVRPSTQLRDQLGLRCSGHPYPSQLLAGREMVTIEVGAGDLYVINSAFVHAVLGSSAGSARVTAAFFLGQMEADNVLISWT